MESEIFPVKTKFGIAVYFTVAIWIWWVHGRNAWNLKLTFVPIKEEEVRSKNSN